MKKILCIIDSMGSGGAQRQLAGLASSLVQFNYDVDLAYYTDPMFYGKILSENKVRIIKLHSNNRLSKIWNVAKLIRNNKYHTVISYIDGPSVICCILRFCGMKFKLIVSERNVTQFITKSERIKFYAYRYADAIVPNSYSQNEFIKDHFPFLSSRTKTITNFVDTNYFCPSQMVNNEEKFKILVVARINKQKNIPVFLHAVKILKERNLPVSIEWFGDYDSLNQGELLYNEIIRLKEKLMIGDYISFHKATTEIKKEYQSCDLFCLPSLFEGYPNVVCEAMSCGKPIVCSRVCDNPRIVNEGVNGLLFNPKDATDMANVIERLIKKPKSELVEWGKASRKIALDLFSMEVFGKKYIELIESI